MFIRQMIIDVTNIKKGTYPQQVKVLLGPKNKKKLFIFQFSICHTSIHSTRPIHFHRPVVYHDVIAVPLSIACLTPSVRGGENVELKAPHGWRGSKHGAARFAIRYRSL